MLTVLADIHSPCSHPSGSLVIPKLSRGHLHEIHLSAAALATAMAFAFTASGPPAGTSVPILLVRAPRLAGIRAMPFGEGLAGLGIDPARLLLVEARDNLGLLRAVLDGARCSGLAAVVAETWGPILEYDLTASRRLVLAAEASRVPVIVLRGCGVTGKRAEPRASAAHTRWAIRPAPSTALEARAPGPPALEAELLRQRGGPSGMRWRLVWNDEYGCFQEDRASGVAIPLQQPALSGAVVPLSPQRAGPAASLAA